MDLFLILDIVAFNLPFSPCWRYWLVLPRCCGTVVMLMNRDLNGTCAVFVSAGWTGWSGVNALWGLVGCWVKPLNGWGETTGEGSVGWGWGLREGESERERERERESRRKTDIYTDGEGKTGSERERGRGVRPVQLVRCSIAELTGPSLGKTQKHSLADSVLMMSPVFASASVTSVFELQSLLSQTTVPTRVPTQKSLGLILI